MQILPSSASMQYVANFKKLETVQELLTSQVAIVKKENRTVDDSITDLYIFHATNYFPRNGIINPKLNFEVNLGPENDLINNAIKHHLSIIRPTVHFALNSLVSEHKDYAPEQSRFIVIDTFESAKKSIVGGYIEDLFCIGPYQLSPQAILFIPKTEKSNPETVEKVNQLKSQIAKIFYYEGKEKQIVINFLKSKNSDYLNPLDKDPDTPNLLCRKGLNKYVSSVSLMESQGKTFCTHDITPTAQIEYLIGKSTFTNIPPFLNIIKEKKLKDVADEIKGYVMALRIVFKLNKSQEIFIKSYEKSILDMLKLFYESKSVNDIIKFDNSTSVEFGEHKEE